MFLDLPHVWQDTSSDAAGFRPVGGRLMCQSCNAVGTVVLVSGASHAKLSLDGASGPVSVKLEQFSWQGLRSEVGDAQQGVNATERIRGLSSFVLGGGEQKSQAIDAVFNRLFDDFTYQGCLYREVSTFYRTYARGIGALHPTPTAWCTATHIKTPYLTTHELLGIEVRSDTGHRTFKPGPDSAVGLPEGLAGVLGRHPRVALMSDQGTGKSTFLFGAVVRLLVTHPDWRALILMPRRVLAPQIVRSLLQVLEALPLRAMSPHERATVAGLLRRGAILNYQDLKDCRDEKTAITQARIYITTPQSLWRIGRGGRGFSGYDIVVADESPVVENDLSSPLAGRTGLPQANQLVKLMVQGARHCVFMSSDIDNGHLQWFHALAGRAPIHLIRNSYHNKRWHVHLQSSCEALCARLWRALAGTHERVVLYTQNITYANDVVEILPRHHVLDADEVWKITRDMTPEQRACLGSLDAFLASSNIRLLLVSPAGEVGLDVSIPDYFDRGFLLGWYMANVARQLYQQTNRTRRNKTPHLNAYFQYRSGDSGQHDQRLAHADCQARERVETHIHEFQATFGDLLSIEYVREEEEGDPQTRTQYRARLRATRVADSMARFEAERVCNARGNHMRDEFLARVMHGGPDSRIFVVAESPTENGDAGERAAEETAGTPSFFRVQMLALARERRAAEKQMMRALCVLKGAELLQLKKKQSRTKDEELQVLKSDIVAAVPADISPKRVLGPEGELSADFIETLMQSKGKGFNQFRNLFSLRSCVRTELLARAETTVSVSRSYMLDDLEIRYTRLRYVVGILHTFGFDNSTNNVADDAANQRMVQEALRVPGFSSSVRRIAGEVLLKCVASNEAALCDIFGTEVMTLRSVITRLNKASPRRILEKKGAAYELTATLETDQESTENKSGGNEEDSDDGASDDEVVVSDDQSDNAVSIAPMGQLLDGTPFDTSQPPISHVHSVYSDRRECWLVKHWSAIRRCLPYAGGEEPPQDGGVAVHRVLRPALRAHFGFGVRRSTQGRYVIVRNRFRGFAFERPAVTAGRSRKIKEPMSSTALVIVLHILGFSEGLYSVLCKDLESRVDSNADALCDACGKLPTEGITVRSVITLLNKRSPGPGQMLTRGGQHPNRHYQLDPPQFCTLVDQMGAVPMLLPNAAVTVVHTLPLAAEFLRKLIAIGSNCNELLVAFVFQKKMYAAETDWERRQLWKRYLSVAKRPLVGDEMIP
jgi:hypothetical protein